jgi:hypothetical protein
LSNTCRLISRCPEDVVVESLPIRWLTTSTTLFCYAGTSGPSWVLPNRSCTRLTARKSICVGLFVSPKPLIGARALRILFIRLTSKGFRPPTGHGKPNNIDGRRQEAVTGKPQSIWSGMGRLGPPWTLAHASISYVVPCTVKHWYMLA